MRVRRFGISGLDGRLGFRRRRNFRRGGARRKPRLGDGFVDDVSRFRNDRDRSRAELFNLGASQSRRGKLGRVDVGDDSQRRAANRVDVPLFRRSGRDGDDFRLVCGSGFRHLDGNDFVRRRSARRASRSARFQREDVFRVSQLRVVRVVRRGRIDRRRQGDVDVNAPR